MKKKKLSGINGSQYGQELRIQMQQKSDDTDISDN